MGKGMARYYRMGPGTTGYIKALPAFFNNAKGARVGSRTERRAAYTAGILAGRRGGTAKGSPAFVAGYRASLGHKALVAWDRGAVRADSPGVARAVRSSFGKSQIRNFLKLPNGKLAGARKGKAPGSVSFSTRPRSMMRGH